MKATDWIRTNCLAKRKVCTCGSHEVTRKADGSAGHTGLRWMTFITLMPPRQNHPPSSQPEFNFTSCSFHKRAFGSNIYQGNLFVHIATKPRQHFSFLILILCFLQKQIRLHEGSKAGNMHISEPRNTLFEGKETQHTSRRGEVATPGPRW